MLQTVSNYGAMIMNILDKIPKAESVWGTITTKELSKFVITYNILTNKYYLYKKEESNYYKLAASYNATDLLSEIRKHENKVNTIS